MNKLCPFKDFVGRELREGDEIIHPSGQRGMIVFRPDREESHDDWVVNYQDGSFESRLCLQVGDEVMALSAPKCARTFQLGASRHIKYKAEKHRQAEGGE